MLKLLKTAAGSAASIIIADLLGLSYSPSAGIMTLLTIQDTSKETISISLKRVAAFLIATLLSFAVFGFLGYHAAAYGVFLLLFISVCQFFHLKEAVSTNAVLVTHYLMEGHMEPSLILNEALLLFIGAGIGTLLNLYIPGKKKEIRETQRILEDDLKTVLFRMSEYILKEDKNGYTGSCFDKLSKHIAQGEKQAFAYMNNTFFQESKYFMDYMQMRRQQCTVLRDIYKKIVSIRVVPIQAKQISDFIRLVGSTFGESNNALELLAELNKLFEDMKESALPVSREEFENRAVLFLILKDFEYFLELKKDFADALTEEQIRKYWIL